VFALATDKMASYRYGCGSGHGSGFGFGFPNMVLFYTKYPHRIIPGIESRAGDKYAMDMDVDVG